MRVQVPFTAMLPGRKRTMKFTDPASSISKPSKGSDFNFDYLKDLPSCPPSNATQIDGTFYAFHSSIPPDPADFQTASARGSHPTADQCKRRSNSIWSDLIALKKKMEHLKKTNRLYCQYISAGKITSSDGVIDDGQGPHRSFWVCAKTSMHRIFTQQVL